MNDKIQIYFPCPSSLPVPLMEETGNIAYLETNTERPVMVDITTIIAVVEGDNHDIARTGRPHACNYASRYNIDRLYLRWPTTIIETVSRRKASVVGFVILMTTTMMHMARCHAEASVIKQWR